MTNEERAEYGFAAIAAGDPDYEASDDLTSTSDTLANILHACDQAGVSFDDALTRAREYHTHEIGAPA